MPHRCAEFTEMRTVKKGNIERQKEKESASDCVFFDLVIAKSE